MHSNDDLEQEDAEFEPTDELEVDETDMEATEGALEQKMKRLREQLKACEKEKMTHLEDLQRTRADFLNGKRRLEEQLANDKARIAARHMEELLPLADSFEMSLRDTEAWKDADTAWQKGVMQMHAQLQSILAKHGVVRVGAVGEPFDPAVHEAVANEPVDDIKKHHTVMTVLQSGYTMNDTVIRPARVTVGEFTE